MDCITKGMMEYRQRQERVLCDTMFCCAILSLSLYLLHYRIW